LNLKVVQIGFEVGTKAGQQGGTGIF